MSIPLVDLKAQYQQIKPEIDKALAKVLQEADFILGENVGHFEKEFARFCGAKYGLGVANATDGLYLALRACGVSVGDEVVVPVNTFMATAEAVTLAGARPVFVDINSKTYNLDAGGLEKVITKKTKAIMVVHLYGQPAQMEPIFKLARRYKLKVIEDAAQAHGAEYQGQEVGSFGDLACFSFYPSKNLGAYGDAGIVITSSDRLAGMVRILRDHGRINKEVHEAPGINSRLDELQAAVLRVKLKHLSKWNQARQRHAAFYDRLFKNVSGLIRPFIIPEAVSVYYFYVIRVSDRDRLQKVLQRSGIAAGVHYPIPLHLQPAYKSLGYKKGDFPQAEKAANEILSLPVYPELSEDQIKHIAKIVKAAV